MTGKQVFVNIFFDVAAPAKVNAVSVVMAEKALWLSSAQCPEQAKKIMDMYSEQLEITLFLTTIHLL